ncbi:hypothetical protein CXF95_09810 [Paraglaciecola sp. MB-3u-78]|nr:hypothetical protein CXF95_09810 [Paraglaciecola sp. MB-3u-78]
MKGLIHMLRYFCIAIPMLCYASFSHAGLITSFHFSILGSPFELSWVLPSSPTPDLYNTSYFEINDVSVYNVATGETLSATFYGYANPQWGGFELANNVLNIIRMEGSKIYSGSPNNPVFVNGTYFHTDYADKVLVVADVIDVHEPASLALFALGLSGLASRRLKKKA